MSSAWILTWQCAQLKRLDILCCKRMTKRPIAATTLHTIKLCIIKLSFISIYTLYPELEPKSCQLQHLHKYCLVKFQIISSFTTKKKKKVSLDNESHVPLLPLSQLIPKPECFAVTSSIHDQTTAVPDRRHSPDN